MIQSKINAEWSHTQCLQLQNMLTEAAKDIYTLVERGYSLHYKDSPPPILGPSRPNGCVSHDTCYLHILQFQGGNKLIGHKAKKIPKI
jgi:hypothetical protein